MWPSNLVAQALGDLVGTLSLCPCPFVSDCSLLRRCEFLHYLLSALIASHPRLIATSTPALIVAACTGDSPKSRISTVPRASTTISGPVGCVIALPSHLRWLPPCRSVSSLMSVMSSCVSPPSSLARSAAAPSLSYRPRSVPSDSARHRVLTTHVPSYRAIAISVSAHIPIALAASRAGSLRTGSSACGTPSMAWRLRLGAACAVLQVVRSSCRDRPLRHPSSCLAAVRGRPSVQLPLRAPLVAHSVRIIKARGRMAVKAKRSFCRIASSSTSPIARHSSSKAIALRGEKNFPVPSCRTARGRSG